MTSPLHDYRPFGTLRVCDLAQGIAGPHCTMLLAQYGAQVTKIEPMDGDWGRTLGKQYDDLAAHGVVFNRGKRSIALDLKDREGVAIVRKIAGLSDVFAESFRPGVMARFGLGYEEVRKLRDDIVYVSVTGFGQEGPNAKLPVTDSIIQAYTGFMTVNADEQGVPRRFGMIAIDVMTGVYAFQAVSVALFRQAREQRGLYLDVSMMQAAAAFQAANIMEFHLESGQPLTLYVPMGTMRTADGFIQITAMRDRHFAAMAAVLGRPEWGTDPRYATRQARLDHEREVMAMLRERFLSNTTAYWAKALTEAGVMNAPISDYGEFLAAPHTAAAQAVSWIQHDTIGRIPVANVPGVSKLESGDPRSHAPHIGQHTREILRELGYRDGEIDALSERRVVGIAAGRAHA